MNNENKNINSNINYHLQNNKYFTGREVKTVITSSSPKVNDDKIKIKSRLNYRASKLGLSSNDECIKTQDFSTCDLEMYLTLKERKDE